MNPNFLGRMVQGCPYKSHLGILGIKATKDGSAAFDRFRETLQNALGVTATSSYHERNDTVPMSAYIGFGRIMLLFVTGADGEAHTRAVLEGTITTFYSPQSYAYNIVATRGMIADWGNDIGRHLSDYDHIFLFGHSYGGVCCETLADFLNDESRMYQIAVETYGSPRSCIYNRIRRNQRWTLNRNVHSQDVVAHVPFHSNEAPLAARATPSRVITAFDASGHTRGCNVYEFGGSHTYAENNTIRVSDTTTSMIAWGTYTQHLGDRRHELETYVSTMTAAALASPAGQLPPANVTTEPVAVESQRLPPGPGIVVGVAQTPAQVSAIMENLEQQAAANYFHRTGRKPARGVRNEGVSGVEFMGDVQISASHLRSAKNVARRLNKIRRLLGPVTTDQRSGIIAAVLADFEGPPDFPP